ncbi:putative aldouronate transport system substrate-binding protein [Paenibacillus rhizosphaerae]|uniref:Putative aldouronate transport system substrate-binding protein n=1 Tax=Paenibacillus rhizosphaerae TaxID=297318 RepID=A0A839TFI4_9BACL|nr:extracellular solute-binding protein [Paenibacillus rhizosphaerae]MBB3125352.1 putative aldouronate transport system substrate-binding protein [Paenibacillus rhizosphaerae]
MKKSLKALAGSFLALSLIVGCSNGNNGGNADQGKAGTASEPAKNEERLPITIAVQYWSGPKWTEDHPTIKYLEEKFNVDITLQLINGSEYGEKMKVMAASGSLPDFYRADSPETYLAWQSEGAFVELSELLPKYPNLIKAFPLDHEANRLLNPEGKIYGLPDISWTVRDTIQIRKDWLDNLGMKLPSEDEFTVDKYYEIAKAFATKDPDKNGVAGDTYGIIGLDSVIQNAFGIANGWFEKDGKLLPKQTQVEEYKAYLSFMKKAYDEGVLDRDFVLRKSSDLDDMKRGNKAGIYSHHNDLTGYEDSVKKAFPDTKPELVPMAPPIGPTGIRAYSAYLTGMNKQVINAKASPEKVDRILQILDWWVTDEGTTIMKSGLEGIDYTKKADGSYEPTAQWETNFPRYLNSSIFARPGVDFNMYLWTPQEDKDFLASYKALAEKYTLKDAAAGLTFYSDTYKNKSADLSKNFDEAMSKIIVGSEPIEYIEQASKEWLANGGDKIIQEINAAAVK